MRRTDHKSAPSSLLFFGEGPYDGLRPIQPGNFPYRTYCVQFFKTGCRISTQFLDRLDSVAAIADEAYASPDAWCGLVSFMERMAEIMAGNLGLRQMLMYATYGRDLVAVARQRNEPLIGRLVQRAQAAGQLRADVAQTDIPFIVFMLTEAAHLAHAASPGIWRRYLTLVLDGMQPGREGVTPLPVAAMRPDEMEKSMRQAAPRHR